VGACGCHVLDMSPLLARRMARPSAAESASAAFWSSASLPDAEGAARLNAPLAAMAAQEEKQSWPRWQDRTPVDVVAPQHQAIHALLIRWGLWAVNRAKGRSLASIESLYTKERTSSSTAPLSADPMLMAVERAMISLPEEARATLVWIYADRLAPISICSALGELRRSKFRRGEKPPRWAVMGLRYEGWSAWAFLCRSMVVNRLRRRGEWK
jgi:hypothetical protein